MLIIINGPKNQKKYLSLNNLYKGNVSCNIFKYLTL